jgi:hypothetical protein
MAYSKEIINQVRELTEQGYTQKEIFDTTQVDARTQRRWKRRGYSGSTKPTIKNISSTVQSAEEAVPRSEFVWPDITAGDLQKTGFVPEMIPIVMTSLGVSRKQGNDRLARFVESSINAKERWPEINEEWCAVIAGFPIVAEDIGAPSLNQLASLAREIHPYINKHTRREYHRRVRPLLVGVLAEVQAFLQDAALAGGFPMILLPVEPKKPREIRSKDELADLLMDGKLAGLIPPRPKGVRLDMTWTGVLFDIVNRLPDPDRQHGGVFRKTQLAILLYLWCSTAPRDFTPALPSIVRRTTEDHQISLANLYLRWRDQDVENQDQ